MDRPDMDMQQLENDIINLIERFLSEDSAILGINIGSHGGSYIASYFKEDSNLNKFEISAASSSLLFLSSKTLMGSLMQEISYNLITGKSKIVISILAENITMICYLNRELAELEGVNHYILKLKKLALQISAFVETSELIKEEIFVAIKRAIPSALMIAIISKEGLPIKIQSTMAEPIISAMISALYNLSDVLLEGLESLEYSIIAGENGSIIIHELDENRILCVAVPEEDESKLGSYIAKIKSIIK
ncbi:MAG: roadblock/LC7 domain-containing protein [Candidatus Hermodarchaeota archaeon]